MTEKEMELLANELKSQRINRNITQEECATYLNISVPAYRQLENNPHKLSMEQALRISELLKWNIFEFFLGEISQNVISKNIDIEK